MPRLTRRRIDSNICQIGSQFHITVGSTTTQRDTLQSARQVRDSLKSAIQHHPASASSKPRFSVLVRLVNGTEMVREYAARHPSEALRNAKNRGDVQRVLNIRLITP